MNLHIKRDWKLGGQGSGHGIKRPDHTDPETLRNRTRGYIKTQKKHLKSLFSDKLDPSCHRHKKERDRLKGIEEDKTMVAERRKSIALEYKDMQDIARRHVEEVMEAFINILRDPDASPAVKVSAGNAILDRAHGKAATTNLNINANADSKPADLSDAELSKRIERNLSALEGQRGTSEETEGEERPTDIRKYN